MLAFSIAFSLYFAIVLATMVIRMRHTRAHTKNRRSHHALKAPTLAVCSNCEAKHRPHHMCLECGFYNGKMVVDMTAKKKAREERLAAKKATIAEQEAQFTPEADPTEEPKEALEAETKEVEDKVEEVEEKDKKEDK